MVIDIVTIFPDIFEGFLTESMLKKAQEMDLVKIRTRDLREFTTDKHRQVDDYPYGGGKGMILKPEPIFAAVEEIKKEVPGNSLVILLSPQGVVFSQQKARELACENHLIFLCGHYEGIDERVREVLVDEEISIGDYILTGGEVPAMVITDAVVRLLPGLLSEDAKKEESFEKNGMLEYPQYTRPSEYRGIKVPEVLLSGDHARIENWRYSKSWEKTARIRPDLLLNKHNKTKEKK